MQNFQWCTDPPSDLLTRHQKLAHQIEPVKRRKVQHDTTNSFEQQQPGNAPHLDGQSIEKDIGQQLHSECAAIVLGADARDQYTLAGFQTTPEMSSAFDLANDPTGTWLGLADTSAINTTPKALAPSTSAVPASFDKRIGSEAQRALPPEYPIVQPPDFGLPHFSMDSFLGDGDFLEEDFQLPFSSHGQFGIVNDTSGMTFATPASVVESVSAHPESTVSKQQPRGHGAPEQESNVFSRIGSPLPSSRTILSLDSPTSGIRAAGTTATTPCWKISSEDYKHFQTAAHHFRDLLPHAFTLPSRHMISHFLERCINSLYKHQPCLHIPTFRPVNASLELVLAMCAVGAQLRFESRSGVSFFHASKALIMARLQNPHLQTIVDELLQPSVRRPEGSESDQVQASPIGRSEQPVQPERRLQTMQALLTLMSFGSWGPQSLLAETMALQGMLAMLAREEGLGYESHPDLDTNQPLHDQWMAWVVIESARRIKTIAYYFTNLQSLAYNMPPPLLTTELRCFTPATAQEWAAPNAQRWDEARRSSGIATLPFHIVFQSLFQAEDAVSEGRSNDTDSSVSAMGNYALIFAILQCIYYLRQRHPFPITSTRIKDAGYPTAISKPDFNTIAIALQRWQERWESCPESTIEPEATAGPISFNSIACLRLAWIRLFADLGPCRNLATRDPAVIGRVFSSGPAIPRHPQLTPVLLQAIHALSVPVRLGVKFVSRSQTMFWSVNQSLCTLECAVVFHRWFESLKQGIASVPLTNAEKGLLAMLGGIVAESGFFESEDDGAALKGTTTGSSTENVRRTGSNMSPVDNGTEIAHEAGGGTNNNENAFHSLVHGWTVEDTPIPTPPAAENDTETWQRRIAALSVATARLWAEVFSNNHVFDLVTTIGETLSTRPEAQGSLRAAAAACAMT